MNAVVDDVSTVRRQTLGGDWLRRRTGHVIIGLVGIRRDVDLVVCSDARDETIFNDTVDRPVRNRTALQILWADPFA